jgi:hypothetical protein
MFLDPFQNASTTSTHARRFSGFRKPSSHIDVHAFTAQIDRLEIDRFNLSNRFLDFTRYRL